MDVNSKSELLRQNLRALGARIRAVRTAKGMKQEEFGKLLNVSQVAVSNWERGKDRPEGRVLSTLAAMTADADLRDYFVQESGMAALLSATAASNGTLSEGRLVRLLKDSVAAGTPRAMEETQVAEMLTLPRTWLPSSGEIFALKVAGNSMAPIIEDGFIVLVDTSKRDPRRLVGRMVAAREGDGVTIKWLRKDKDAYLLVPQHVSPRIPVRIMRPEDDWAIVGVVLKWIGYPPSEK